MNLCSFPFLVACCVAPVVFHLLPAKPARRFLLTALNLAFLITYVPNMESGCCLTVFLFATYSFLWSVRRSKSGAVVFLGIASILAYFLIVKKYSFLADLIPKQLWEQPITAIGLSYMLFKYIHVLVDSWQEQIDHLSFWCYLNYQIGFFSLIAGPIQRYNDFQRSWESMDEEPAETADIAKAWNRILTGMIKMGFIATVAQSFHDRAANRLDVQPTAAFLMRFTVLFYSYAVYLYFNFSGYTDIAIGVGKLFGFELPENFNRPYLARNVIDFWNRWHISLTNWIREYLFMTSYKWAATHTSSFASYFGYILLCVAFILSGVWHGATSNFAIFGLINGIGAMVSQIYGDVLKRVFGRKGFHRYLKNIPIQCVCILLTIHFFCFSLLFFSMETRTAVKILSRLFSILSSSSHTIELL